METKNFLDNTPALKRPRSTGMKTVVATLTFTYNFQHMKTSLYNRQISNHRHRDAAMHFLNTYSTKHNVTNTQDPDTFPHWIFFHGST